MTVTQTTRLCEFFLNIHTHPPRGRMAQQTTRQLIIMIIYTYILLVHNNRLTAPTSNKITNWISAILIFPAQTNFSFPVLPFFLPFILWLNLWCPSNSFHSPSCTKQYSVYFLPFIMQPALALTDSQSDRLPTHHDIIMRVAFSVRHRR